MLLLPAGVGVFRDVTIRDLNRDLYGMCHRPAVSGFSVLYLWVGVELCILSFCHSVILKGVKRPEEFANDDDSAHTVPRQTTIKLLIIAGRFFSR